MSRSRCICFIRRRGCAWLDNPLGRFVKSTGTSSYNAGSSFDRPAAIIELTGPVQQHAALPRGSPDSQLADRDFISVNSHSRV